MKDNLSMVLFNNAIDIANYDDAYMALSRICNFETYLQFYKNTNSLVNVAL